MSFLATLSIGNDTTITTGRVAPAEERTPSTVNMTVGGLPVELRSPVAIKRLMLALEIAEKELRAYRERERESMIADGYGGRGNGKGKAPRPR